MAMTPKMLALHRWLGLVAGVFVFIAGATAVGLNHADQLRDWTEARGPSEGPYAHGLLATYADPRDAAHVLVGTTDGLFETTDGTRSWHAVTLPAEGTRVGALVADAARPGRVWATVAGKALLRSDDAGRHWAPQPLAIAPDAHVSAIALDAAGLPVLATELGLYRPAAQGWALLPRPEVPGVERAKAFQSFVAELHMGDVYGRYGIPVTDAIGLSLIALVLTGYFLFIQREYKVRSARRRARLAKALAAPSAVPAGRPA